MIKYALKRSVGEGCDLSETGIETCKTYARRMYRNVLVTRSGICLQNGIILSNTIHRVPRLYPKFLLRAYGSALCRKWEVAPEGQTPVLIHNAWSHNYFHWVTEALPRLLRSGEALDCIRVIIPTHTRLTSIMRDTLSAMGVVSLYEMPTNRNVWFDRILIPDNPRGQGEYDPAILLEIRRRAIAKTKGSALFGTCPRLYISRSKANRRHIANEREVVELLSKFGFETVLPENFSFLEQVRIFNSARIVVGQHGAGLTNLLFMNPQGSVIEMVSRPQSRRYRPRAGADGKVSSLYKDLSTINDTQFQYLMCDPVPRAQPNDDVWVDCGALEDRLRALCE